MIPKPPPVTKTYDTEESICALKFVFTILAKEVENQIEKWGYQHHSNSVWLLILLEEIGEVADAMLKRDKDQINAELIQCAAVIVSWLRDNRRDPDPKGFPEWFVVTIKKIGEAAKAILEDNIQKG